MLHLSILFSLTIQLHSEVLLTKLFGIVNLNSLPNPNLLFTAILPLCISTKECTKDNPIPLPS